MSDVISAGKNAVSVLLEKKGEDVKFLDLRKVNSYLDYFIIVTGSSKMHLRSLSRSVQKVLYNEGYGLRGKPEFETEWIVLDYGELIIHIFSSESRSYYDLERLWADAEEIEYDRK
ncbi:MAG: ribosome silencing factor [Spirochaetes bacterium]|nr:ribosome silencing factor [Spirochaetota bacterium]